MISKYMTSKQEGLTLVEMVIALSVIVLVLVLASLNFDQNGRRAESLQAKMQLVRAGVVRFQHDLPCGPSKLSALTLREDAAVGLCGDANNLNNWRGPYIESASTYVNSGDSELSEILPGSSLSITREVVGSTIYTLLRVNAISDEMRSAMINLCADDCTPYKAINGDETTIGLLISELSLQAMNSNSGLLALNATASALPPGPAAPGPVIPSGPFVPPPIAPPAFTATTTGPISTPTVMTTSTLPPGALPGFTPSSSSASATSLQSVWNVLRALRPSVLADDRAVLRLRRHILQLHMHGV